MVFTKRLREAVKRGDITYSVRIWLRPHVKKIGKHGKGENVYAVRFCYLPPRRPNATLYNKPSE
jgi:hypothetical protein